MGWKLLLFAMGCSLALAGAGRPAQYDASSDGQSLNLEVGDLFDVTLAENPTTGFRWEAVEGLDGAIEQVGEPQYAPDRTNPHLMGGGGAATFHFQAVQPGTAELRLAYHRKWEKDVPPLKSFHLTINVSPRPHD